MLRWAGDTWKSVWEQGNICNFLTNEWLTGVLIETLCLARIHAWYTNLRTWVISICKRAKVKHREKRCFLIETKRVRVYLLNGLILSKNAGKFTAKSLHTVRLMYLISCWHAWFYFCCDAAAEIALNMISHHGKHKLAVGGQYFKVYIH